MKWVTCALCLSAVACGQWEKYDGERPNLGTTVTLDAFKQATTLDHLLLASLVARHSGLSADQSVVLLDYKAIADSVEASYLLDQYLAVLATVDASQLVGQEQRLAYWINGYNAAVIKGVVARFGGDPTFKVTDQPFFDDTSFTFGGVALTLNQLEQGVARGKLDHAGVKGAPAAALTAIQRWHQELWQGKPVDARLHAAFNCAALSCPNLWATKPFVFDPAQLSAQLSAATRAWLDSPKKGAGPDGISRLFDWYGEDFEAEQGGIDGFITRHRTQGLNGVDRTRFLDYDWTLNILQ